jgi:hypothetical protein
MLAADGTNFQYRRMQRLAGLPGGDRRQRAQRFLRWRRKLSQFEAGRRWYAQWWREFAGQPFEKQWVRVKRAARRVMGAEKEQSIVAAEVVVGGNAAGAGVALPEVLQGYVDALDAYVPGNYGGRIVLIWPREDQLPGGRDPRFGWWQVCPKVELITVSGEHQSSLALDANLREVGAAMRRVLEQATAPLISSQP